MDSFTLNKIAGAVLGTCLLGMGLKLVGEAVYEPGPPAKPGYALPDAKPAEAVAGGDKAPAAVPIAVRLASADPKRGETAAKVCGACHNFQEGAGAKVGPALYGVVDRPKGKQSGFDYSAGMKGKGGEWTYADLDQFLTKPSAYVPGTKMGYAGEEDAGKRADIISWLRTLAKDPAPLPQVSDAAKAAAPSDVKAGEAKGGEAKPGDDGKPTQDAKLEEAKKTGDEATGQADFLTLVGSADPKKGQAAAQVCQACHNVRKGGGALIGPALWNVVDRKKGSLAGYDYSAGLKAKGGDWSVNDLNAWLTNPQAYIPGTKMGYPGESNPKKRAEIIAYLRTLSDSPISLPNTAEGEAKAKSDHPASEAKMTPDAKPGDQSPPAPANKPGALQPVPKLPEATDAAGGPTKPDQARPGMPAPAPTPDEPNHGEAKPAGNQHSGEAAPPSSSQQAALPTATPIAVPVDETGGGPEPYHAADPQIPAAEQSTAASASDASAKALPPPPSFTPDGDKGSDRAPEPYSAPTPGEPN